jgi:hypothetical protein
MSESSIIIYPAADGKTSIQLRVQDGSVWLTQMEIADLFLTTKQNVGQHIKKVLAEKELAKISVVKESFTTAADGKAYKTQLYISALKGRPFNSEGQRPGNKDSNMMISPERA